jgi:hypothetical protein
LSVFFQNWKFLTVSVGFIFLHKTQTMTSRFVTVLVEQKEAKAFPLSLPQRTKRIT